MDRKVRSREELLENKQELLASYYAENGKNNKAPLLTKKERKILGIGKDQGKAILRHVRISPRKVKIVLDLIKEKSIDEATAIVKYTPKAASEILYKLLKSAEANAVNNNDLNRDALYVFEAFVSPGAILKRMKPAARGKGAPINKRSSHITIVVKER